MILLGAEIDIMARTVYGESRGEADDDRIAVAWVIVNRWRNRHRREHTLVGVATEPSQFSCWNPGDPNRERLLAAHLGDPVFAECYRAVLAPFVRGAADPTGGADHYYARWLNRPAWAAGKTPCYETDAHFFFNDID